MHIWLLLKGMMFGFSVAAIIGPIWILCARRSITEGFVVGFVSGLGAGCADVVWSIIAGFGLTFVSSFLLNYVQLFQFIAGIALITLGVMTFRKSPPSSVAVKKQSKLTAFITIFLLTMSNPITIVSFTAIFASSDVVGLNNYVATSNMIAGIFIGASSWWFLLALFMSIFGKRLSHTAMIRINKLSGTVIGLYGIAAVAKIWL